MILSISGLIPDGRNQWLQNSVIAQHTRFNFIIEQIKIKPVNCFVLLRSNRKYHRDNPYSRQPACYSTFFISLCFAQLRFTDVWSKHSQNTDKLYRYLTSTSYPESKPFFVLSLRKEYNRAIQPDKRRSICRILFRLNRKHFHQRVFRIIQIKNNFIRYWKK